MTISLFNQIVIENNIPSDSKMMGDSGMGVRCNEHGWDILQQE